MTNQNVTKWICEFKEGRTEVHYEERNGYPSVVSCKNSRPFVRFAA